MSHPHQDSTPARVVLSDTADSCIHSCSNSSAAAQPKSSGGPQGSGTDGCQHRLCLQHNRPHTAACGAALAAAWANPLPNSAAQAGSHDSHTGADVHSKAPGESPSEGYLQAPSSKGGTPGTAAAAAAAALR
jgi:hypothetical protein